MKCYIVSLGCPKNLIDTENIMNRFLKEKADFTYNLQEADLIFINTCAFIEKAIKESINTILEIAELKRKNQKIVVAGCLVSRFKNELEKQIPEIDCFIDTNSINSFNINKKNNYCSKFNTLKFEERIVTTYPYAYLRISEGCSHKCSFCTIPNIRGPYREKSPKDIEKEFISLLEKDIKEIILVAQDTSAYQGNNLAKLLKNLSKIDGDFWLRVLYLYPYSINSELVDVISNTPKIVPYFDIPLQHISDKILKLMRRNYDKAFICNLFDKLLRENIAIRSTFIVGFPNETQSDFDQIVDFINNYRIDRLGVFEYSKEKDTKSAILPNHVNYLEKHKRRSKLLSIQKNLSKNHLERFIGKTIRVIVDQPKKARSFLDAPQIDGIVKLKRESSAGSFKNVLISKVLNYDLVE